MENSNFFGFFDWYYDHPVLFWIMLISLIVCLWLWQFLETREAKLKEKLKKEDH